MLKLTNSFSSKTSKIFCVSIQRTGTTSVGMFFKNFHYRVADWSVSKSRNWSQSWYLGNFEKIFKDQKFIKNQVFEDDPWWLPDFYKVLYHRFPDSKFILFKRDPNDWFDSMLAHSNGKTLGNTFIHSKVYRRESEYYKKLGWENVNYGNFEIDNALSLQNKRNQYIELYETRNFEVETFFKQKDYDRIFISHLENKNKWKELGEFFGINVPKGYDIHLNKSRDKG